jgi:hypothetical protein
MIFVDTSVWVDYFRLEHTTLADELDRLLDGIRLRLLRQSGSSVGRFSEAIASVQTSPFRRPSLSSLQRRLVDNGAMGGGVVRARRAVRRFGPFDSRYCGGE